MFLKISIFAFATFATLSVSNQGGMLGISFEQASAAGLDKATQEMVNDKFKQISSWGKEADIVSAVKAFNGAPPAEIKDMTHDKWKTLGILDPIVRGITKTSVAKFLKSMQEKDGSIAEAFVSGANGTKVGFLSKTSGWSHKGNPKHDLPMQNKQWTGAVEVDESTGVSQIQLAVPVLDQGTPIGSIVVGYSIAKMKK